MSDEGRKDWSTKTKEEITPDSSKSTLDKTKEKVTNVTDKARAEVQPDSTKGTSQSAYDKGKREEEGGIMSSVKVASI